MIRVFRPCSLPILSLALLGACLEPSMARARGEDGDAIEFNRDVRPILSENCYACHGPDHRQRKADLRLDEEEGALAELPSGNRAIVPGQPDESELVFRVEVDDAELQMPPPEVGQDADAPSRWRRFGAGSRPGRIGNPTGRSRRSSGPRSPGSRNQGFPATRLMLSSSPDCRSKGCRTPPRPTASL